MSKKSYERKGKGTKEEAKEFILDQLKEHNGTIENRELLVYAQACGYASATLERAKKDLKKDNTIAIETIGKGKDRLSNILLVPKEG